MRKIICKLLLLALFMVILIPAKNVLANETDSVIKNLYPETTEKTDNSTIVYEATTESTTNSDVDVAIKEFQRPIEIITNFLILVGVIASIVVFIICGFKFAISPATPNERHKAKVAIATCLTCTFLLGMIKLLSNFILYKTLGK